MKYDGIILGHKPGQILIWNDNVNEARWKTVFEIESETKRKERKQKLEKLNVLQSKLQ